MIERILQWSVPEPNSGCWLWIGTTIRTGYGNIKVNGKHIKAHRASWEEFRGKIPDGLEIDHLCRVKCCVNPDHLEPVTHRENMRRGVNASKTHCARGHAFSEENTYVHASLKTTARCCRICRAENRLRYINKRRQKHPTPPKRPA